MKNSKGKSLNYSFSGDTCTALENFQENPYNNTLSSILPCDELLSAESVLSDVSAGIYNLVNEVIQCLLLFLVPMLADLTPNDLNSNKKNGRNPNPWNNLTDL